MVIVISIARTSFIVISIARIVIITIYIVEMVLYFEKDLNEFKIFNPSHGILPTLAQDSIIRSDNKGNF